MQTGLRILRILAILVIAGSLPAQGQDRPDAAAVERGRIALTQRGHLKKAWNREAYDRAGGQWGTTHPDPKTDPSGYQTAFNQRYGLHPAPYPNDGLPMGLRAGMNGGIQIDCMVCHGGSIGGKSYVGLGNSTLDLRTFFDDVSRADGQPAPLSPFTLTTTRGTVNAGQIAAFLLSLRNADFSRRRFPLPLGADLPELDTPAWWHLKRKKTMYYDGRTPQSSVRTNMQFIMGEKSLDELKELESTFSDIRAYLLSLTPPKYPFPIDSAKAERGQKVFLANCKSCHGTYGPDGKYPSKIVALEEIGTDPARAKGLSDGLIAHYNATWFGDHDKANPKMVGYQASPLDGIWATAPYFHNGSVPTIWGVLKSSDRPSVYRRPSSTGFEHYDQTKVGWKVEVLTKTPDISKMPGHEARYIFDASRVGLGNQGHTFGDELTDAERMDLIEYLKTL